MDIHGLTAPAASTWPVAGHRRTFTCDPASHLVVVRDDTGTVLGAFGGRGHGLGRLETPLDAALVRPAFAGEPDPDGPETTWLAVADYGNRRIQLFELDGAWIAALPLTDDHGRPWAPIALAWRTPVLEVGGVDGSRTRLYLSGALLERDPAVWRRPRLPRRTRLEARH